MRLLMGVHNCRQVYLTPADLSIQRWNNPVEIFIVTSTESHSTDGFSPHSLWRISWIDDHRVLCRFICHDVSIIVTRPSP